MALLAHIRTDTGYLPERQGKPLRIFVSGHRSTTTVLLVGVSVSFLYRGAKRVVKLSISVKLLEIMMGSHLWIEMKNVF